MRLNLIVATALAASPVAAQEPPDYIAFTGRVERYAVAASSVGSCPHFGYTVSAQPLFDLGTRIIGDAVRAGMPEGSADTLFAGLLGAENDRQAERARMADTHKEDPAAVETFFSYWRDRCARLARDPEYSLYFRR